MKRMISYLLTFHSKSLSVCFQGQPSTNRSDHHMQLFVKHNTQVIIRGFILSIRPGVRQKLYALKRLCPMLEILTERKLVR